MILTYQFIVLTLKKNTSMQYYRFLPLFLFFSALAFAQRGNLSNRPKIEAVSYNTSDAADDRIRV